MLTASIAEDELLVRMGISNSVPWSELDTAIVGEAREGAEACQLYQKHRPDILIPDILMTKMSGVEVLERIQQIDQRASGGPSETAEKVPVSSGAQSSVAATISRRYGRSVLVRRFLAQIATCFTFSAVSDLRHDASRVEGKQQQGVCLRNYRTIRRHIWRCLFRHLLLADFSIYRQ